ncbi:toprim domain-containing protein [Roseobacter sp. TSBP12]|uniref:DUF7146 domain-containing protein n=1 Tax=Roseobacter sp. TSBP12 TaxID=1236613 RepID=UPI00125E9E8B|nr:toprim domain-containing protein [Roseobacter sp. TSBP12]KAB6717728.1 hypothetical protein C8029_04200 [Roseobacter sp. TSBP12]
MNTRQTYSIDEIKHMLLGRVGEVAQHYAPPANGSYEAFGKYFTLNPGRADRSVGSFYVHLSGPNVGKWADHAVESTPGIGYGDILDLIALSCRCDMQGALAEARAYLGLQTLSAEDRARREEAGRKAAQERKAAEARDKEKAKKRADQALSIWLSGQEKIRDTPVEAYLRDARGIDLAQLGRQPRALRYHPETFYQHIDRETGEVFEAKLPAMLAIVNNKHGKPVALHRTYLGRDAQGRWRKADLPCGKAKKVLGAYRGDWINIWTGAGPRGGKGKPLSAADGAQHVYIAEGIEDALSGVCLLPEARFIAAISLSNMGGLDLPRCVERVTLIADRDENEAAKAQLQLAIRQHQKAGRVVRIWQNTIGGKDLNDALRAVRGEGAV